MEELLKVSGLSKTFHLSKKQQKLERPQPKLRLRWMIFPFVLTGGKFLDY